MPVEIHQYDVGTAIEITIRDCSGIVNLSAATSKQIVFVKPNKTRVVVDSIFITDGVDGGIQYIFEENDLDVVGIWKYQAVIVLAGKTYHSDQSTFKVFENL